MTDRLKVTGLICIFIAMTAMVFAQDDPGFDTGQPVQISRVLGDQYLNIGIGMQIPLFIQNLNPSSGEVSINPTNLHIGLSGGLGWAAFVNNNISLGLEVNAAYSSDLNKVGFFMVPITVNSSYFLRLNSFEIPLQLGAGMAIMKYKDITTLDPMAKAGVSLYWDAVQDWAFGINVLYWWIPEIYSAANTSIPQDNTRIGNFLEITLSAMYNF